MDIFKGTEIEQTDCAGYVEFEFDLPHALLTRLVEVFVNVDSAVLSVAQASSIPDEQGVYQLFLDETLVYVGKTDGDAGLRSRLARHATKIRNRNNLDPRRVSFRAVRIFVFTAMDLEGDLIRHYGGVSSLAWNGSGFGSNDPGKERDTTRVKSSNFDAQFPIDLDAPSQVEVEAGETAADVLTRLKQNLTYTLRYQNKGGNSRLPHNDLSSTKLGVLSHGASVRTLLSHVASSLPSGWHVTALPGYIIMYKDDHRKFPSGTVIARSP